MENNSTDSTREALVNDISALKRDVTQVAVDVREHAGAHVEATKKRINDRIQKLRDAATARPLAILGVGFLIGFIVGYRRR